MNAHPTLILDSTQRRSLAHKWIDAAPSGYIVTFKKPGRTIPQNSRLWAMLTDVSIQTKHNGVRKSPEAWKALFMHAFGHECAFEVGLSGEPFPVGFRSSKMSKAQMIELQDFIEAWAAEKGLNLRVFE